jgi:hypothetical protein
MGMTPSAISGALTAVIGALPIAALCALVYRFPIPFSGYESGPQAAVHCVMAVVMYGVFLGGFIVLAALGAVLGWLAAYLADEGQNEGTHKTIGAAGIIAGLTADAIVVGLMANWDYIYGPW